MAGVSGECEGEQTHGGEEASMVTILEGAGVISIEGVMGAFAPGVAHSLFPSASNSLSEWLKLGLPILASAGFIEEYI